ncbi:PREDICTED: uncharacterized protein LOC106146765 [Chinchilla lanigera]|uniref:uncharacterized protein LOC106146765 n=1 Tax=Chinchilla lanigera TaxID=34839 RepID=UPI000698B0B5|nr:PREDICTED: uncharacterized protein LOC106146765 [Chinchilla lanigera]
MTWFWALGRTETLARPPGARCLGPSRLGLRTPLSRPAQRGGARTRAVTLRLRGRVSSLGERTGAGPWPSGSARCATAPLLTLRPPRQDSASSRKPRGIPSSARSSAPSLGPHRAQLGCCQPLQEVPDEEKRGPHPHTCPPGAVLAPSAGRPGPEVLLLGPCVCLGERGPQDGAGRGNSERRACGGPRPVRGWCRLSVGGCAPTTAGRRTGQRCGSLEGIMFPLQLCWPQTPVRAQVETKPWPWEALPSDFPVAQGVHCARQHGPASPPRMRTCLSLQPWSCGGDG